MTHLPDPLSYYEKGFLTFLIITSLSLIGFALNFYLTQLRDAQENPSNSISLLRPDDGIPIPDIYLSYDYYPDLPPVEFICMVYRVNAPEEPCPFSYSSLSNITIFQSSEGNMQTKAWILFTFPHLKLASNNVDNVLLYINTTNFGYSVDSIVPQLILYQRTEEETQPYGLEEVVYRSYSITPSGGAYVTTYSLSLFKPINKQSYYLVNHMYNGFLSYNPLSTGSIIFIMPNSPHITINREFIPIGHFNVFSSIWSIISLCFLVISTFFTRQMPKIHLYFTYRNEISFVRHFLTCQPCRKEEEIKVSV